MISGDYSVANFEKYIEPWLKSYPDIEILKLEDLIKDPNFLRIDNFSIPHNYEKDMKSFISIIKKK